MDRRAAWDGLASLVERSQAAATKPTSALALALAAKFPGAIEEGVATIGAPVVVYASEEAHHSLENPRACLGSDERPFGVLQ